MAHSSTIKGGKWLTGVSSGEPVRKAARRAIRLRVAVVGHYLPRAADDHARDTEFVHQLRVAARRLGAATEAFATLLPSKRGDWIEKQLRRLRRAAGEARDLDVLAERFPAMLESIDRAGEKKLLRHVARERKAAQEPIEDIHRRWRKRHYDRRVRKLLERIRFRSVDREAREPSYEQFARERLRDVSDSFFASSVNDSSDVAALHAFRIQGKRLRYAMELFAAALPAEFRQTVYPQIVEIQEHLGQINDHASAHERLTDWAQKTEDEEQRELLSQLAVNERAALERQRLAFLGWWTDERKKQFETSLAPYLAECPAPSQVCPNSNGQSTHRADAPAQGQLEAAT